MSRHGGPWDRRPTNTFWHVFAARLGWEAVGCLGCLVVLLIIIVILVILGAMG